FLLKISRKGSNVTDSCTRYSVSSVMASTDNAFSRNKIIGFSGDIYCANRHNGAEKSCRVNQI
ncbi:hypothetical protein, partial [Aggregatibacter actinomycetemcomitans]|uniref:hypothetical protein n=1 Tax=Aggregatibacter actinomycetemcomitans TaxID=714 RepID=UPI001E4D46F1